jgi:hypothetical protein
VAQSEWLDPGELERERAAEAARKAQEAAEKANGNG